MKKSIVFVLLAFLLGFKSQASISSIDSIKIFPTSPSSNDTVRLIAYLWFPDSYGLQSNTVVKNDTDILVSICYFVGNDEEAYLVQDTITLGKFPVGNYRLLCTVKDPGPPYSTDSLNPCSTFPFTDSAVIKFSIRSANSIVTINPAGEMQIYPNPTDNKLFGCINSLSLKTTAKVISADGHVFIEEIVMQQGRFEINVSNLPAGLYFLEVQNESERWVTKFVKE